LRIENEKLRMLRLKAFSIFNSQFSILKGFPAGTPQFTCLLSAASGVSVAGFVRPDPISHLILQTKFPLLQRFLLDLLLGCHLVLGGELTQACFALVMLFDPLAELGVLGAENLLNVSGTIRHRSSSFEVAIAETILAPPPRPA